MSIGDSSMPLPSKTIQDDAAVTHSELAAAGGATLVGVRANGAGTVTRTVAQKLGETVFAEDFGAIADGVTDCYASLQSAIDYLQNNGGGVLRFARGNYVISQGLVNDRETHQGGRVSFVGTDETSSIITCLSGTALSIRNGLEAGGAEPNASNQVVRSLSIFGTNRAPNSAGLLLDTVANIHIEDVRIQSFDFAIYAQDMDQAYLKRCELRFNNAGIFARKNPDHPDAATQPNNWVIIQCGIGSNTSYGCQWVGGSNISFFGGIIATNGHGYAPGESGFGAAFTDCGYEGGVGANFYGTYFEDNNGIADVIVQSTGSHQLTACIHNLAGCSFNRISTDHFAHNSIRAIFGPALAVGQQRLNVTGCSFKSLGSYAPASNRDYIEFTNERAGADNFFQAGNIFEDSIETPAIAGLGNQPWSTFARLDNTTIDPNIDMALTLSAQISSSGWPNDGGGIVIPSDGNYLFTAQQVFSTNVNGYKRIRVLRGGQVLAAGSVQSSDNVVTATGMSRFAKGDIVSADLRQESSSNMIAVGASAANSFLMLTRVG